MFSLKNLIAVFCLMFCSAIALASGNYPSPNPNYPPTPSVNDCEKVADLVDSSVDLLVCKVENNSFCLATSTGGTVCGLPSGFRYTSGNNYSCGIVAQLLRAGGGYPLEQEATIQVCEIGRRGHAVSVVVSTLGGISLQ
jgi:hypothetical protein